MSTPTPISPVALAAEFRAAFTVTPESPFYPGARAFAEDAADRLAHAWATAEHRADAINTLANTAAAILRWVNGLADRPDVDDAGPCAGEATRRKLAAPRSCADFQAEPLNWTLGRCPECGKPAYGVRDLVPATALLTEPDALGRQGWEGYTAPHWDNQRTERAVSGAVPLICEDGHEWDAMPQPVPRLRVSYAGHEATDGAPTLRFVVAVADALDGVTIEAAINGSPRRAIWAHDVDERRVSRLSADAQGDTVTIWAEGDPQDPRTADAEDWARGHAADYARRLERACLDATARDLAAEAEAEAAGFPSRDEARAALA